MSKDDSGWYAIDDPENPPPKDAEIMGCWIGESYAEGPWSMRWDSVENEWNSSWDGSEVIESESDWGRIHKALGPVSHWRPMPSLPAPHAK